MNSPDEGKDTDARHRCAWARNDPLLRAYHDTEWGVPERDSRALWEKLMLDGFQAGLSWLIILRKREAFREAFRGFDPAVVAEFGAADVARIMADPGVVRSVAKIEAAIGNARAYLAMAAAGEDFSEFVWKMAGGQPIVNRPAAAADVPTKTPSSEAISKELKKRGFKFVGPVIVYAWMQAVGIVDDHTTACFRCLGPKSTAVSTTVNAQPNRRAKEINIADPPRASGAHYPTVPTVPKTTANILRR